MASTDTPTAPAGDTVAEQRRALPDAPGVYLFRDRRGRVLYVGKAKSIRKRVGSHFSKPATRGTAEMLGAIDQHRLRRHPDRGRGAARGAELHQASPAAVQHPPARRQVVPLHRDLARRGLPAGLLHAREAPPRARLLRAVLEREARARDARPARQGLPAPQLRRPGARPRHRQPVPRLLHQALPGALRRLHLARGVPRERRHDHRLPLGPLPRDRARPRGSDEGGVGGAGVRARGDLPEPLEGGPVAARAPADLERGGRHARRDRGRDRGGGRERAGVPGPRRRAGRPPELLPRERRPAATRARSRRSSCSSTTRPRLRRRRWWSCRAR